MIFHIWPRQGVLLWWKAIYSGRSKHPLGLPPSKRTYFCGTSPFLGPEGARRRRIMPASNVQAAFRHLVQTSKKLAKLYNVPDDGASKAMKPGGL